MIDESTARPGAPDDDHRQTPSHERRASRAARLRSAALTLAAIVGFACVASLMTGTFGTLTAFVTGGSAGAAVPDPIPPIAPLSSVPVPAPQNIGQFVSDRANAVKLGKALFWDMQVGSDGVTACATCHFSAGADSRSKNELNPRVGDFSLNGPNYQLQPGDFPFHQLSDPNDQHSAVTRDTENVTGSQGVLPSTFVGINPGSPVDDATPAGPDPVFNVGGTNVRRATGRNAPSVIDAVFNFRNFWDGRAENEFNGVDPFGARNPNARVAMALPADSSVAARFVRLTDDCTNPAQNAGVPEVQGPLCLTNASLASQAVGPPGNGVEMSADGRSLADIGRKLAPWKDVGKKLAGLRPLARQMVSPTDSVLGSMARPKAPGLDVSYPKLIKDAFQPRWWDSSQVVVTGAADCNPDPAPCIRPRPDDRPLNADEYTLMDYNFSLFFGLAIQEYESTLVADQTPFDAFASGDSTALSPSEQQGLDLFRGLAGCVQCHGGAEFTNASVSRTKDEPLEQMVTAAGNAAIYDQGFYNIGVRPCRAPANPEAGVQPTDCGDLGVGAEDPFGKPLSMTRLAGVTGPTAVDGSFKAPDLRNVALTAPYFHNGGQATLRQVVDFYNRGGDFHDENLKNLDPNIQPLGLSDAQKNAVVAFLSALTDQRVRLQSAPFDHPQLFLPNGALTNPDGSIVTDGHGQALDRFDAIPAVGRAGGAALPLFLGSFGAAETPPPVDEQAVPVTMPEMLDLGSQQVGSTSAAQTISVVNAGAGSLQISSLSVSAGDTSDFTLAGSTCTGVALATNDTCTVSVRFRPTAVGARMAQLTLVTNTVDGSRTVTLQGTGLGGATPTVAIALPSVKPNGTTSAGVPVTLSWQSPSTTVARYDVEWSRDGFATTTPVRLARPAATTATITLPSGGPYVVRVRAVADDGTLGEYAPTAPFTALARSENDPSVVFSGTWKNTALSGAEGGTVKSATANGPSATLSFVGTSVSLVSAVGPNRGMIKVVIDGNTAAASTVDLYASAQKARRIVLTRAVPPGQHTIQVVSTGKKRAASTGTRVDVDGFVVLGLA